MQPRKPWNTCLLLSFSIAKVSRIQKMSHQNMTLFVFQKTVATVLPVDTGSVVLSSANSDPCYQGLWCTASWNQTVSSCRIGIHRIMYKKHFCIDRGFESLIYIPFPVSMLSHSHAHCVTIEPRVFCPAVKQNGSAKKYPQVLQEEVQWQNCWFAYVTPLGVFFPLILSGLKKLRLPSMSDCMKRKLRGSAYSRFQDFFPQRKATLGVSAAPEHWVNGAVAQGRDLYCLMMRISSIGVSCVLGLPRPGRMASTVQQQEEARLWVRLLGQPRAWKTQLIHE